MNNRDYQNGMLSGVYQSIAIALMGISTRILSESTSPHAIVLLRSIGLLLLSLPFVVFQLPRLFKKDGLLLIARGVFGGLGVVCLFYNLGTASAAIGALLGSLSPLLATIFSFVWSKKHLSASQVLGITLCLLGTVGLGASGSISLFGLFVGILGATSAAISLNLLSVSSRSFSPIENVFTTALMTTIFVCTSKIDLQIIAVEWKLVAVVILSSFIAQIYLTMCFRNLDIFSAVLITRLGVVFLLLLEVYLGLKVYKWVDYVYLSLIILGVTTSFYKSLPGAQPDSLENKPG